MRPDSQTITLTLAIALPVLCAVAVGIGRTADAHSESAHQTAAHALGAPPAPKVANASPWNVDIGPDPFLLPRRPKSDPPIQIPLRKVFHVDTPFVGHTRVGDGSTGKPTQPPVIPDTVDTVDRMAGFLSGNGVYAVLETPSQTMVVNPGDRVDDNRVVTDIRPTSMHLRSDNGSSLVTLRSSL